MEKDEIKKQIEKQHIQRTIDKLEDKKRMWHGVWDEKNNRFLCFRYKFAWNQFDLPYFGDVVDTDRAGFAPMKRINEEKF